MRTGVGQGLACHFQPVLCTVHGFNVVCAAGLVLRSCEIVLGHRGCQCFASWEEESLFKFSIRIQLPAGEWHSAGLVSEQVSLNGFGRFLQLKFPVLPGPGLPVLAILWAPWNCSTWRNSASLVHTVTLRLTAAQCRLSPPPSATHPMHHLWGLAPQPGVALWRLQPWICCWLRLWSKV